LSAIEKPSPSLVLKIINAPFFLWLLTAVVFTLGVGYYNTHHPATDDGQAVIARVVIEQFQPMQRIVGSFAGKGE